MSAVPILPDAMLRFFEERLAQPRRESSGASHSASDANPVTERERAYARAALNRCVDELAATSINRNDTLNAVAYGLGRMIGAGWLDRSEVEAALLEACRSNGYIDKDGLRECVGTLESGLDSGIANPHAPLSDTGFEGFEGASSRPDFDEAGWEEPKPLPTGLLEVAPFDPDFLPDKFRPWVMDISERMQCAPDYIAIAALTAAGAAIGRRAGIKPKSKDNWTVVPNLWGMVIGPPGEMKSPAMNEALKPLKRIEAKAADQHKAAVKQHGENEREYKLRKAAADKLVKEMLGDNPNADIASLLPPEPNEPRARRFIVSDATYESLVEIISYNPGGVLSYRDEIISLLKHLDREENANARGFYMSGWNGDTSYTVDRIGRGHQHIDAVSLSVLGTTQPSRIAEYIGGAISSGAGGDGMMQRFALAVWPDRSGRWKYVDRLPDDDAANMANAVFERLTSLGWTQGQDTYDFEAQMIIYRFDDAAAAFFVEYLGELEHRLRSGELSDALASHLGKYRKLVPSLALIIHLVDGHKGPLTLPTLERAIALAAYLETHAQRVYAAGMRADVLAAEAILKHIKKGDLTHGFTLRDIHQRDWSKLTNKTQVQDALDLLVDYGWLRDKQVKHPKGGRPTTQYLINPRG